MSTGKTVVSAATQAIALEQLRRQQEELAERERCRIGAASEQVTALDIHYRQLVARRDRYARDQPDLSFLEPPWPELEKSNPSAIELEAYASRLQSLVNQFERDLNRAVCEAEDAKNRRHALALAWRNATALEQALPVAQQQLAQMLEQLHEPVPAFSPLTRPNVDAGIETVQAFAHAIEVQIASIQKQKERARRRVNSHHQAATLAGETVAAPSARHKLEDHADEKSKATKASLQSCLDQALKAAELAQAALPPGTQVLIKCELDANQATNLGYERIQRLVARERAIQDQVARAHALMSAPPDLVHAKPSRSQRWSTLLKSLQAVAAGQEPLTSLHEVEYEQIKADAQRDIDRIFVQNEFAEALRAQDLLALQTDSGELVIEDLRNLGVRMEESTPLEFTKGQRGGMATVLELKSDRALPPAEEAAVVDDVCARLQAAARSTQNVQTACVELEHNKQMKRSRRPANLKRMRASS